MVHVADSIVNPIMFITVYCELIQAINRHPLHIYIFLNTIDII